MNKIISPAFSLLVGTVSFCLFSCAGSIEEPIDLEGLRSAGDDWTVVRRDTLTAGGAIKLHHDKWLMYFLHWRPLTGEKEDLSIESVRNLMLSFWGPDMPFTLSEAGGETEVAGHRAYHVDGTIYEGRIQTQFIVWNCPQTERQFISDCNINVGRGTPLDMLDLQRDITLTISCHGQLAAHEHPLLTWEYVSEKYNLSFHIPDNWRTRDYHDDEWFPEGMTATNGTLWTLLTDSEKYVELWWDAGAVAISEELFLQYIMRIENDSVVSRVTSKIVDLKVGRIIERDGDDGYLVGEGTFGLSLRAANQEITKPFLFKAFLWNKNDTTHFLLAAMIALQEFWKIPVGLAPTTATFDHFLRAEILANVNAFNYKY